jgi:hypothetical protein
MPDPNGAIAQLGERLHGMQEVSGSIPLSSTNHVLSNNFSLKTTKYRTLYYFRVPRFVPHLRTPPKINSSVLLRTSA